MEIKKPLHILLIFFFFLSWVGNSQNKIIHYLKNYQIDSLQEFIQKKDQLSTFNQYAKSQIKLIKHSEADAPFFINDGLLKTDIDSILNYIIHGDYNLFKNYPEDSIAQDSYRKALNISFRIKDTLLICEASKKILFQLSQNIGAYDLSLGFLKTYKNYLYDINEKATYLYYKHTTDSFIENNEKINELKKGLVLANQTNNILLKAKYNQMLGVYFSYFKKKNDSALFYMKTAKNILEQQDYKLFSNELFGIYGNIGQYIEQIGNYKEAKKYYLRAGKIQVPKYRYLVKVKLNKILSENSLKMNLKDSALYYLKKSNTYKDTLNEYEKAKSLYDLNRKYNIEEKEKIIDSLEEENVKVSKVNKNLIISIILVITIFGIISYLLVQNSQRKRLLALQEKELETQKNLTLLKEQEITSINAMVEGQEKERKRVAEDLNDNLGSVIATLKLHFDNLRINRETKKIDQEILFDKTEGLIDEAYKKVRSIAHAKNSGVIANQGLLMAVQMMTEKISSANKIQIEVINYGLEKPIENSLEISLFRIIQELTTNILKHSQASQATINISQDQDDITILVEDNGIGMNASKINYEKGMGLHSIKTRVEHLKGSFTIDSTLTKGTTIIINIPI